MNDKISPGNKSRRAFLAVTADGRCFGAAFWRGGDQAMALSETYSKKDVSGAYKALNDSISVRRPTLTDAVGIFDLMHSAENLDKNSLYLYLLLCRDFSATCRVAELDNRLVGAVTAYLPSHQPKLVFVWQVAVAKDLRGRSIALTMLTDLVADLAAADPWLLQTTITPSNTSSQRLFQKLADYFRAPINTTDGFNEHLFTPYHHESEMLYTIGPIAAVCEERRPGRT